MRIVFMGTAEFGVPSLKAIAERGYELSAVVTGPDKPQGRGQKIAFTPVKIAAEDLHLPVIQPDNLKDSAFADTLRQMRPDVICVIAFRILPREVFAIPRLGSFNLHASLLPKYRGAAPIPRAIMNGETETGVTTFFLKDSVDTGDIIVQKKTPIGPDENAGELYERLARLGSEAVMETLDLLKNGKISGIPQDDSKTTPAPKIFKDDCRIDWNQPAEKIKNHVRALNPTPGAWTLLNQMNYKIFRVTLTGQNASATELPGTIIHTDVHQGIFVLSGDRQQILINEIQPPSKKKMSASEFLRGYPLKSGERFE